MTGPRVLVLGARARSLGEAVATEVAARWWQKAVVTAGVSGDEHHDIDVVNDPAGLRALMESINPTAVVCTVGTNIPRGVASSDLGAAMQESFTVNVMGPMVALRVALGLGSVNQFVAISSNSAQIARRGSIPYCASKAALSMALRVAAREVGGSGLIVYGYEFGLLQGTPMTLEVAERFEGPLTRIPGAPAGLPLQAAARSIVDNLEAPWQGLNGVMLRLDGGEQ